MVQQRACPAPPREVVTTGVLGGTPQWVRQGLVVSALVISLRPFAHLKTGYSGASGCQSKPGVYTQACVIAFMLLLQQTLQTFGETLSGLKVRSLCWAEPRHPVRALRNGPCGQAEVRVHCSLAGAGLTHRSGQRAVFQASREPGARPVLTGVSAGSSWGHGCSARGRSLWAPPWRQLEHLQVPLLMSPARGMQGKTGGR